MSVRQVSKYFERSSRTSSESRDSDSVVKPTRSANSTDTRRRSAVGASTDEGASLGAADCAATGRSVTGVPHSPQKRSPAASGDPQLAHARAIGAPHWTQNFLPAAFSVPQVPQINAGPRADSRRLRYARA